MALDGRSVLLLRLLPLASAAGARGSWHAARWRGLASACWRSSARGSSGSSYFIEVARG